MRRVFITGASSGIGQALAIKLAQKGSTVGLAARRKHRLEEVAAKVEQAGGRIAISLNILGIFLHFVSDAQKYYTLKYKEGLITEGFFERCRNTNYLGEILIYSSFALLAQHWLPFLILGSFISMIFIPNMLKKDQSLSRYPEFADYKRHSGLLFPLLFVSKTTNSQQTRTAG